MIGYDKTNKLTECWDCREYTALSDVSLSVCNVIDYRLIGRWYRIKATSWIAVRKCSV